VEHVTRITLTIDAGVLSEFKRLSAETHRTLDSVVEDALRDYLARLRDAAATKPVDFPVVGGRGLAPGVDLASNAALAPFLCGAGL
jgi:hypothetical protein